MKIITISGVLLTVSSVLVSSGTGAQAKENPAQPGVEMDMAGSCRRVRGTFEVTTFACSAPAGLCGTVQWHGGLEAQSTFTATANLTTADTPSTSVVLVTGDALLSLSGGTLSTKDAVVIRFAGAGDFAEVDTIVGGTGAFTGVTGAWRAAGTFQDNQGRGRYEGELCGR